MADRKIETSASLLGVILLLVLLALPACGPFNPEYRLNNQVRLAIYQHERAARGKTDDLILQFNRTEPRIRFPGQDENDGRTVWLIDLGAREYFDLLPPDRTYLYVQTIEYNADHTSATVDVYRGDVTGYQGRELVLTRNGSTDEWVIAAENEIQ